MNLMVLVLSRQKINRLKPLFNRQQNFYHQIYNEILTYSDADHARIFAQPEFNNDIVRWNAEGQTSFSWKELDQNQQQKLLQATRSILLDIEEITQHYPGLTLSRFFNQCRQFPGLDFLYAVDGKPVITAWGFSCDQKTYDPLMGVERKKRNHLFFWNRFPWITALSAFALGLLTSIFWTDEDLNGKKCEIIYPSKNKVRHVMNDKKRQDRLADERNKLLEQWNILQNQCRIPSVKPLVPIDPTKIDPLPPPEQLPEIPSLKDNPNLSDIENLQKKNVPKPPVNSTVPPKTDVKSNNKVDLPKESWNKKDTTMLKGCWHLTTHLELYTHGLFFNSHQPVTNWSLCFNQNAAGHQVLTRRDGGTCQGPLYAGFQGEQLVLNQPEDCQGDFHLISGKNVCTRLNDREARCTYIDENGHQSTGIFKR